MYIPIVFVHCNVVRPLLYLDVLRLGQTRKSRFVATSSHLECVPRPRQNRAFDESGSVSMTEQTDFYLPESRRRFIVALASRLLDGPCRVKQRTLAH